MENETKTSDTETIGGSESLFAGWQSVEHSSIFFQYPTKPKVGGSGLSRILLQALSLPFLTSVLPRCFSRSAPASLEQVILLDLPFCYALLRFNGEELDTMSKVLNPYVACVVSIPV